ncbi:MAG: TRAP transporter small permease [Desulfobacteraceae bacterium]|jgi:TRAP-type C4-dicarboxylate transport system permease small subunit
MNNSNPLQFILRFFQSLSTYLAYIGALSLFLMMCLTIADVVGRFFNRPILGAFELTEFMVLVLIFSFLAYAQSHKAHINVDLFMMFFPGKLKNIIELFNHVACLAIMVLITWTGFENAVEIMEAGESSPNLALPNYPFVFFLVIGCAIMCIEFIRDIIVISKNKKGDSSK